MKKSSHLKRILSKLKTRQSNETQKLLKEQAARLKNEKRIELAEKDRQIKQLNAAHRKEIRGIEKNYNLRHLELDRRMMAIADKDAELSDKHDQLDTILADSNTYLSELKGEIYQRNLKDAKLKDWNNRRDFIVARSIYHKKSMRN